MWSPAVTGHELRHFYFDVYKNPNPLSRELCRSATKMALWALLLTTLTSSLLSLLLFSAAAAVISGRRGRRRAVGFFHPYTNDGGGGERVLWCAVKAVQEENPDLDCAVFTGDDASPQNLSARALDRFGVKLLRPLQVAPVPSLVCAEFGIRIKIWCFFFQSNTFGLRFQIQQIEILTSSRWIMLWLGLSLLLVLQRSISISSVAIGLSLKYE